jgi:hypothetical protein
MLQYNINMLILKHYIVFQRLVEIYFLYIPSKEGQGVLNAGTYEAIK